jgi:hypothetical protein
MDACNAAFTALRKLDAQRAGEKMINTLSYGNGNYPHWWPMSAHARGVFNLTMSAAYDYDPAEDGPECELITRILAADWNHEIDKERARA